MLSRKVIIRRVSSYLSCFVWCLIECCQFVFLLRLADTVQILLNMHACKRKEIKSIFLFESNNLQRDILISQKYKEIDQY